jgi:urease accessory protein
MALSRSSTGMTTSALLTSLQYGDSAFPSGGFAFSWGLEGLHQDGLVSTQADVFGFIEDLLLNRWRTFDRIVLHRVYTDRSALVELDLEVERATWSAPMRKGSRRAGRALLAVSARLGSHAALAYRSVVSGDDRLGHLPVIQGIVWKDVGVPLSHAETLGAWSLVSNLVSAAVRLGIFGHLGAQSLLSEVRDVIIGVLAEQPERDAPLTSFTPVADIALMRHDRRDMRLFST